MPTRPLRTRDIARALGVHVNTIRLYEASGYLPAIPRDLNGYRHYSNLHLEQARLVQLALQWPTLGDRALLLDLVTRAASGDCGMAMELAYQYLVARGSSAPMPRRRLSSLSAGWRGRSSTPIASKCALGPPPASSACQSICCGAGSATA